MRIILCVIFHSCDESLIVVQPFRLVLFVSELLQFVSVEMVSHVCLSKLWLVEFVGHCWLLGLICVVSKDLLYAVWCYYLLRVVLFEDCLELLLYCSQRFKTNHAKVALNLMLLHGILYYSSPTGKLLYLFHMFTVIASVIFIWVCLVFGRIRGN